MFYVSDTHASHGHVHGPALNGLAPPFGEPVCAHFTRLVSRSFFGGNTGFHGMEEGKHLREIA